MVKDKVFCDCDAIHADVVDSVKSKMPDKKRHLDFFRYVFYAAIIATNVGLN